MPRSKTSFNVSLQRDFPYLKVVTNDPSSVFCSICNRKVSIAHGGRSDINQHLNTKKHCKAARIVGANKPIDTMLTSKETPAALALQAKELAFAYHHTKHRISGPTVACTSKMIQGCFESKYTSGYTKTASLLQHETCSKIMDSTTMEGNQDECRLCLNALSDPKDIWNIEITTSINEKICEIFPPEVKFLI